MRKPYRLILFILIILIGLCAANIYITLRNQRRTTENLYQALTTYQQQDRMYTDNSIGQAVKSIHVTNGVNGKDGTDGVNGKDGTTTILHEYTASPAPVNGTDGKDGRQVVLGTDPDTGDIVWKYQGDTLWNLLIEKCQLTNNCDKDTQ